MGEVEACFFEGFAEDGLEGGFAGLGSAAGDFPPARGPGFGEGAACDEEAAIGDADGG